MKGSTAIEGLAGSGKALRPVGSLHAIRPHAIDMHRLAMFLTDLRAEFLEAESILRLTWSWTLPDTQIPPGSAIASSRAAILTPSP